MTERERLQQLIHQYGITPNRALGQNFLIDDAAIRAIVDAAEPDGRPVLEIGPGAGALTAPLCRRAKRVVAVEKDAALSDILKSVLSAADLSVITSDILDCDIPALMEGEAYLAVGNLPYYITTPITEKLLCAHPDAMTLMVQAEAAERFFARPGSRVYGPVTVVSQTLFTPMHILDVPRICFYPQPEVDSAVVRLVRRSDITVDAAGFLWYLKRAFAMRRKTLRNNLLQHQSGFDEALVRLGLPAGVRAEAIEPELLLRLYGMYCADQAAR